MKCHYCEFETNDLVAYVLKEPQIGRPGRIFVCKGRVLKAQYKTIVIPSSCKRWAREDGYEREEKDERRE